MGFLGFAMIATVVGLICHYTMRRFNGPSDIYSFILVSIASSLVTAGSLYLYNFLVSGSQFEPPPVMPLFITVFSFPFSLFAGIPFIFYQK